VYGYFFQPAAIPQVGSMILQDLEYPDPEPGPGGRFLIRGTLPAGMAPGSYDVFVRNPDGKVGELPDGFTITGLSTATASSTPTETPAVTQTPTSSPTGTATETHAATATPTPTSTSSPPVTATPTSTATTTPLHVDDFSDPGSGWPVGEDADARYGYLNGEYQILVKTAPWYLATTPGVRCTDCAVEANGRFLYGEGGALGLLFGIADNWDTYIFQVSNTGYYSLVRVTDEGWAYLVDWTSSLHLNTGTSTNRLRAVRDGASIALYANGHYLTTLSDATLLGSLRVGLTAIAYDTPNVEARFDDFAIYAVDAGSIQAGAGAGPEAAGGPVDTQ
jgi:hypothetical protein